MLKWQYMQAHKPSENGLNPSQKSKKKICFFITKAVWGGAQKYVFDLATSLPKDKFEVLVICGKGEALKKKLEESGISVYQISSLKRDSSFGAITIGLKVLSILKKEKPDVLHLNSPQAAGIGAVAGRLLFIPKVIQTVHGFTFNEHRNSLSNSIIYFFTWLTILLCHKTIVIAPQEEKQAKAMLVSKSKIVLIRNGIVPMDFLEKNEARDFLKSKNDKLNQSIWIGTIAELHKNKGLFFAIKAFLKLRPNAIFIIIGEGEERSNLEKLIAEHKLENRVFLLGFVDNATRYLKAFDIYLCSSLKEGLPYTILEAGFAGLPIIATTVGGIPDIIGEDKDGILIPPKRDGAIKRAIEYLIENPEEEKIFGEKIKEKVERNFSFNGMLEKTLELYRS